jgi:uncharacterized protein YodC (DUF2158 family)
MANALFVGNVVVLKSGSPKMTISQLAGTVATCQWFNSDGEDHVGNFKYYGAPLTETFDVSQLDLKKT